MAALPLERKFHHAEGLVRYSIVGDTGPDVILVHGTPWSSLSWSLLIPELAKKYRVHYYDLIGYGQSEMHHGQRVSLDVQGQLLCELVEHWNIKQPHVIAHDFGGAISLRAHLLHGCHYQSLQLIDVVAIAPWGSSFFAHVKEHEEAFAGVPDYIHLAIVQAYIKGALAADLDTSLFDQLVQPWTTTPGKPAFYRQIAQANQKYTNDIQPDYAHIKCPVSILWGEQDSWIPIETGRTLHAAIPQSSFCAVPNAGHLAQLENAEFVNQQVKEFLSKHTSGEI